MLLTKNKTKTLLRFCFLFGLIIVLTEGHSQGHGEVFKDKQESKYKHIGEEVIIVRGEKVEEEEEEEEFPEQDDKDVDDDDEDDDNFDKDHDDDDESSRVDFVDQRQNGTENYRIRVNGLLLILSPPEVSLPPPITTPPSINNNTEQFIGGRRRFIQRKTQQQRRKSSRYQLRIPQFIMSLLRARQ